jgi:hypothetical protein
VGARHTGRTELGRRVEWSALARSASDPLPRVPRA